MITILNKHGVVVGVLTNEAPQGCSYYDDVHRQVIQNTLDTFEFKVRADHETSALLESEGYVVFKDLDGLSKIFTIKEIFDNHSGDKYREVFCEDTAIDELVGNIIRPNTFNGYTAQQMMAEALSGTNWTVGRVVFTDLIDMELNDPKTSLELLHEIADFYEGELYYDVVMSGSSRIEMRVNLVAQRGQYTGKVFEYNKDLENIKKVESSTNLVTALIPVGQNGITIEGMTPTLSEPYYLSSDFIANRDAFQRYNKNGKHIFGHYKDSTDSQEVLLRNALRKLRELSKPKISYDCSAIALERIVGLEHEKVRIGDVVVVKDLEYQPPLISEARVVEIKRSLDNPSADKIVVGDYIPGNITRTTSNQNIYNNAVIDSVINRVTKNESSITQLDDKIELKVSSETFNLLDNRVDTAESSITLLSNQIALKVNTSTFNVLSGRMDTAESSIIQNANNIALKVSTSTFNLLVGRMETAESSIIQNASDISLKVSTTTFNALEQRVGAAELKITDSAIVSTVRSSTSYVSDLSDKEGAIVKQSTAPTHANGKLWLDTSVTPNVLKRSTGSAWVKVTPTTAGEVGAYSSTDAAVLVDRVSSAELKITDSAIVSTVRSSVLYTGDLSAKENGILKQSTAPTHLSGRLWLDTSVTPNILKRSTGSAWIKATPTTAGEVGAYTTFAVDSLFSQTADEIALKVTMGEVVNSLNVNTAGIQINAGNIDLTGITTVNSTLRVGGSTQYGKIVLFSESGVNKALITAESQLFDEALLLTADVVEIGSSGGTGTTTLRFTDSLGGSISGNVVFQNNVTFSGTVTGVPAYFG